MGALLGELEGGSNTGDNEGYEKGFGNGHLTPYGPHWETWRRVMYQEL